jgi:hypothetical protein
MAGMGILGLISLVVSQLQLPKRYENLNPEVQYVGMNTCKGCHQEIYDSYIHTGMGRSYYLPKQSEAIERFGPQDIVYDSTLNFYYRPFWAKDTLWIEEYRKDDAGIIIYRRREHIDHIVGSGHQTRSYILNRNGFLYEAPITWYVSSAKWDMSPGYEGGHNSRFSRPIAAECMSCHNGLPTLEKGTQNRYTHVPMGIDCERCHGAGQLHVKRMQNDEMVDVGRGLVDFSIVNPKKLPLEQQIDVCQQCHLQGVNVRHGKQEYRPSMRLSDVMDVFVEASNDPNAFGIASHAERMRLSKCFLRSENRLTCTTCHNPHHALNVVDSLVYRKACLSCHTTKTCKAPEATRIVKGDNCARCHMPRAGTSDIPHVSFTDHNIRVVSKTAATPAEVQTLKLLCATQTHPDEVTIARAQIAYYEQQKADKAHLLLAQKAESKLPPLERAKLLFGLGRPTEALPFAQQAANDAKGTHDEAFVCYLLAEITQATGEDATAHGLYATLWRDYPSLVEAGLQAVSLRLKTKKGDLQTLLASRSDLNRILAIKPNFRPAWTNLGFVEMNLRNLPAAEKALNRALTLDPDDVQTLLNLAALAKYQGKTLLEKEFLLRAEVAKKHTKPMGFGFPVSNR